MLFDVQAALAKILADEAANPANSAKRTPDLASLADLAGAQAEALPSPFSSFSGISRADPAQSPRREAAPNSTISTNSTGQALHPESPAARRRADLPVHPPTCAVCGVQEWTVAMTDRSGRKLHVSCWKAKGA